MPNSLTQVTSAWPRAASDCHAPAQHAVGSTTSKSVERAVLAERAGCARCRAWPPPPSATGHAPGSRSVAHRQLGIGMARNRCRVSEIGVSDLDHACLKRHIGDSSLIRPLCGLREQRRPSGLPRGRIARPGETALRLGMPSMATFASISPAVNRPLAEEDCPTKAHRDGPFVIRACS